MVWRWGKNLFINRIQLIIGFSIGIRYHSYKLAMDEKRKKSVFLTSINKKDVEKSNSASINCNG